MSTALVQAVRAESVAFAAHHGLPLPAAGARLELEPERDAGGFGAIHAIAAIDGAGPSRPLLAKVFDPEALAGSGGPDAVAELVHGLFDALEARVAAGWQDAVLGLPYSLLSASVDGASRLVALMLDLAPLGYEAPEFAERAGVRAYVARPWPERIEIARRLAERFVVLTEAGFLHGDLNPDNLLVDHARLDVQVIDYDAGAVLTTGDEHPRTPGKPDDCMPPEVKGTQLGQPQADPALYTAAAERWSQGSLIGYCLFGVHPAFFLAAISPAAIEAYAAQPLDWPDIDPDGPLFTTIAQNRAVYSRIVADLRQLPPGTRELFAQLFRAGLDGAARPSAEAWLRALGGLQRRPKIEHLSVDQELVLEGDDFAITWSVPNANFVELRPGGRQSAEGRTVVTARETVRVQLDAFNDAGSTRRRGPLVLVAPLPRIDFVAVPDFPGLQIGGSIPLPAEPTEALEASPAREAPRMTPPLLIGVPGGPIDDWRPGVLPVPPPYTDLLAPVRFEPQPRRRRRFGR